MPSRKKGYPSSGWHEDTRLFGRFEERCMGSEVEERLIKVLVDILCRFMVDESDKSLARDFERVLQDAKHAIHNDKVVDVIVEITRKLRTSQILDRRGDRKRPDIFIHNVVSSVSARAQEELDASIKLKETELAPLMGECADNIWKMCNSAGWSQQNLYDWLGSQGGYLTGAAVGYAEAAEKDRLWSEFYAMRLGFDEFPPKLSQNMTVVALVDATCRLWTMDYAGGKKVYKFEPGPREARFQTAVLEGRECLPEGLTELIVSLAAQQRRKVHETRNGPLRAADTQSLILMEEEGSASTRSLASLSQEVMLGKIATLLEAAGITTFSREALATVNFSASWQEQNLFEADSALFEDKRALEKRDRAKSCKDKKEAS
eukprot:CAMPEP_0178371690 /NCGR_PEP_ID=MMETSP0689_2-20121128/957_1 /TAXON_ID=160604 /ORGANISM="Amphidinium massartii, Strain CS-259" /LENGTH=374 /DNA_ID=CAMNT_0019991569 /DNA_START=66 /DNA_END=1187 /DNA_ORIENTATION=-